MNLAVRMSNCLKNDERNCLKMPSVTDLLCVIEELKRVARERRALNVAHVEYTVKELVKRRH